MSDWAAGIRRLAIALIVTAAPAAEGALFGSARRDGYTGPPRPPVCRVVVAERGGTAYGSGTLVDCREGYGLVVTNWHVVRDARGKIEVRFPGGFVSEGRPLKLDNKWDLAALVIWRPPTRPAPLATQPPRPGDTLTICGYGQGDYLEQTGRCTDYYAPETGEPRELVELSVPARQGDSGGPIFNERGELAGVLFGATRGTTLGSFGGRVRTFLATLAPDIGARRGEADEAALAGAPRPSSPLAPLDPFVRAERSRPAFAAGTPPASLADRSSAPRLAASRHSSEAWRPAPRVEAPIEPGVPKVARAGSAPSAPALNLPEDARTLLALVGLAALVVAGLRAVG